MPFTLISCSSNNQNNNANNQSQNLSVNTTDSVSNKVNDTEKTVIVKVDYGLGEGEGQTINYDNNGVLIPLAQVLPPSEIYEYNDYFITEELSYYKDLEDGYVQSIYNLVLINKYTAEKEEFTIKDTIDEITGTEKFDKENGKIIVNTNNDNKYSFDIESKTFSKI